MVGVFIDRIKKGCSSEKSGSRLGYWEINFSHWKRSVGLLENEIASLGNFIGSNRIGEEWEEIKPFG